MLKKTICGMALLASLAPAKMATVGTGRQYASVNLAVRANLPLQEDLYILVEMPTGSYAGGPTGSDVVDPYALGGFNGYKVVVKGYTHLPSTRAYVEDEGVYDWDGATFHEAYVNIKGLEGVEGRTDLQSTTYYAKDHLHSTRMAVAVGTRTPKEIDAYYSFGTLRPVQTVSDPVTEKFTGKEMDKELGYYYFGARYYNSEIGSWISPDPEKQYFSEYIHCGNNPLNCIDHDGKIGDPTQHYEPHNDQGLSGAGFYGAARATTFGEFASAFKEAWRSFWLGEKAASSEVVASEVRAFWVGPDGEAAAKASGASLLQPSQAALQAAEAGNWTPMRAESSEWAKGARGDVPVFFGNGKGRIFLNDELPHLLNNMNAGSVKSIQIEF